MNRNLANALIAGFERTAAGAELLDRINVFPVADGDTGRNLKVTLLPLRDPKTPAADLAEALMMGARGNSGNIAANFFAGFLTGTPQDSLTARVHAGRDQAWGAVEAPVPGTMLTFLNHLDEAMSGTSLDQPGGVVLVIQRLEAAVRETRELLPRACKAGVADAGALGLFLFWEGFLAAWADDPRLLGPAEDRFPGYLIPQAAFDDHQEGYCLDILLKPHGDMQEAIHRLSALGECVVATSLEGALKVHLHSPDQEALRKALSPLGTIVTFTSDDIALQTRRFHYPAKAGALHIMTDAAGSLTHEDAAELGFTLLESYVHLGDRCLPETQVNAGEMYAAMRAGVRVVTSQASASERVQIFEHVTQRYEATLYLCVGSAFTGNYAQAAGWKRAFDREDRLMILDSGAASGRLAVVVLAAAKLAREGAKGREVVDFVTRAMPSAQEFVFLDTLKYLAAGGRISKPGAFFGDLLTIKPVISPQPEGARKIGTVKNARQQLAFAVKQLEAAPKGTRTGEVLVEYSDNRPWIEDVVQPALLERFPRLTLHLQPLSLTSGAHMGPGTWGIAFLSGEEATS